MARICFPDHLFPLTGGIRETVATAENFRELLIQLEQQFPGIRETLERCTVAIDGQIYQDAFLEPLQRDSEIFFLQRIEAG